MTNLILTLLVTNHLACIRFNAEPFTYYRLERTLTLPATNWLAADYFEGRYEAQPYHFPVTLCDWTWDFVAWRVVGWEL